MAEPRCDRTDLLVSACAHCRPAEPAPARPVGAAIPAMYPGWCGDGCGERIEVGDMIVRSDYDGWVLEGCA